MCKMCSIKFGSSLPRISHKLWIVGNRYGTKWAMHIFYLHHILLRFQWAGHHVFSILLNKRWYILIEFYCMIFILRACMQHVIQSPSQDIWTLSVRCLHLLDSQCCYTTDFYCHTYNINTITEILYQNEKPKTLGCFYTQILKLYSQYFDIVIESKNVRKCKKGCDKHSENW